MARNKVSKGSSQRRKNLLKKLLGILILAIFLVIGKEIGLVSEGNFQETGKDRVYNEINSCDEVEKQDDNDNSLYMDSKLEVYFFDVGQADSILLLTDDKAMLVDTGNAGDARQDNKLVKGNINLTYELKKLGINKIDILVATHAHEDHMGSMYKIINTFEIGNLYANAINESDDEPNYYKRFCNAIIEKDVHLISPTVLTEEEIMAKVNAYNANLEDNDEKIIYDSTDYIRVGDVINFGNAKVTLLAPGSTKYSDDNDYSIVLMVEFEGVKLMLTGDAGKQSEQEILKYASQNGINLACDILKVSHHGSRTANTEDFISAVNPTYAVIMVEEGNKYGLPDEDVIERLEMYNAKIYQTMEVGDIKLVIDDGKYKFDLTYTHEEKEE